MKIIGANRRWMKDYANRRFGSNLRPNSIKRKSLIRHLSSLYKCIPLLPPLSIIYSLKNIYKREYYCFYPCLPLRQGSCVALENYDALFDYNSVKRVIFSPLIIFLLACSRGKYDYYSLNSFKSMPSMLRFFNIRKESTVIDFFEMNHTYCSQLLPREKRSISIAFAGCFYLKGGLELCHALARYDAGRAIKVRFIVPSEQCCDVKNVISNLQLDSSSLVSFEIELFNENNPEFFYETLKISKTLIHPTFYDSHAIVVKEASDFGCFTVATDNFASASFANVKLCPPVQVFMSNRIKFPLIGQLVIKKYSNSTRKVSDSLVNELVLVIRDMDMAGII